MSYLPNDLSLDTTVQLSRVQQNDAALDTAISGNLTEANMNSATRFPSGSAGGPTMLANDDVEDIITLSWEGPGNAAVWPAASASVPADIIRIQGTGTYTVLGASYTAVVPTGGTAGGTTGSLSINAGTLSGTNFASSSTIVSSVAMTNIAGAGQTVGGDLTINTASFTAPIYIAALSTLIGTTCLPRVRITLRMTRSLI